MPDDPLHTNVPPRHPALAKYTTGLLLDELLARHTDALIILRSQDEANADADAASRGDADHTADWDYSYQGDVGFLVGATQVVAMRLAQASMRQGLGSALRAEDAAANPDHYAPAVTHPFGHPLDLREQP